MKNSQSTHMGRKILKIRELRGMKQEILAEAMGVSQQTISVLENSEEVDEKKLKVIADVLGVSVEAIKNFSEDGVINYFNTFGDNASGQSFGPVYNFNPVDKIIELYERLLEAEKRNKGV